MPPADERAPQRQEGPVDVGPPLGSGLNERAVTLVITPRMKRQGIRWYRPTASSVVALHVRELTIGWDDADQPTLPAA